MSYGYQTVSISSGATDGGAGASTNNATSSHVVVGQICSIGVTYNGSPPSSTDVVIATAGNNGPALTILTLTNANNLKITVDDANDGDSVDVVIIYYAGA